MTVIIYFTEFIHSVFLFLFVFPRPLPGIEILFKSFFGYSIWWRISQTCVDKAENRYEFSGWKDDAVWRLEKKKKVRIERDKNRITINNKHKIDRWKEGRNAAAIATDQRNKSKKWRIATSATGTAAAAVAVNRPKRLRNYRWEGLLPSTHNENNWLTRINQNASAETTIGKDWRCPVLRTSDYGTYIANSNKNTDTYNC